MKTNKRKYLSLAVAMAALLATPAYARLNPQVSFTVSIPGAGPLAWDSVNNVLLVGTATTLYAINPTTQAVVASQGMMSGTALQFDSVRDIAWSIGCNGTGCQASEISVSQFLANPGSAPIAVVSLQLGASSLALDLADAEVWMTQGSGAIQEWAYGSGSLSYVQSISTPDGYPAVNLLYIGGTGPGLFVTDHYVMNGVPSSNWWFFSTVLQAWVWDNENSGFVLLTSTSQPVYNAYYGIVIIPYRFSAIFELNYPSEEFDGNEYILDDSNDTGQHITTIDSSAATLGAITSAVEQKTSTQFNQVLVFDTLSAGESDQPEPGLTVPGAVYTALGGGLAWASGAGVVTAITYN